MQPSKVGSDVNHCHCWCLRRRTYGFDSRRLHFGPLTTKIVSGHFHWTYNRSNVLRYAIESVLAQTVSDWEMIVIGDACTDDTAEVVESFGDGRIRFHNLDQNVGEQSGPNNVGTSIPVGCWWRLTIRWVCCGHGHG